MKPQIAAVLAILMTGTVLSSGSIAQTPAPRQEIHIYNGSRGGGGTDETNLQELVFSSSKGERLALITVDDTYNPDDAVALTVTQDIDDDGSAEHSYELCGSSKTPLSIHGGPDIKVSVGMTACDGAVGATMGIVEMRYFRSKKHVARWQASRPPMIDPATYTGKTRIAEAAFHGGGIGAADVDVTPIRLQLSDSEALGGASFMPYIDETFVSLDIADRSGLPTRASIYLIDGSGMQEFVTTICGKTPEPLHVQPGVEIAVQTSSGVCPDGSPAAATQGTITATFYAP